MAHALLSYAAYVPRHRLGRAELAAALGSGGGKGSRAVASYDEDSTTMGVEAARAALADGVRPAAIHFATTAPAYFDKTNATAIHAALDLGHDGFAVDLAGSARGATGALRAAAASGGLAVLSDLRTGRPGSADERDGGDAAAAFLFGDGEPIVANLAEASTTAEFLDRWRSPGELASGQWEERFGAEAYAPLIHDAVTRALASAGVEQPDHVIVSSPHARAAAAATKRYAGRVPEQAPAIGYAGTADPGLRLAAVLDRARPGETILLVVAADGCDATVLEARPGDRAGARRQAGRRAGRGRSRAALRDLPDVARPARPRAAAPARAGPSVRPAVAALGELEVRLRRLPLRGVRAGARAAAPRLRQLPGGRPDGARGALRKPGTVATFTVDRLAFSPSPPVIDAVVDFDGGGRYTLEVADASPEEVEIGTPVQLAFRRLYTTGGVHNYFWKATVA